MSKRFAIALILAVLTVAGAQAAPTVIDLADIVGGGDGSGSGASAGVDLSNGTTTTTQTGPISAPTNTYVLADNPLVDGVLIPDGGAAESDPVPISSTGLVVTGISDSTVLPGGSHSWDHVWNGTNFNTNTNFQGSILGMHANKGVTFDLEAIGAAYGGLLPSALNTSPITGGSPSTQVDYYAFVDGVLVAQASLSGSNAIGSGFDDIPIPKTARFLTLLTSSDGSSTGDYSFFLDPFLEMVLPLELGQIDSFDSTRDGWARGHRQVEDGDGFLRIPGPEGAYMNTYHHGEQWSGDYPTAGVERIRIDLRNEGPENLSVYLVFGTTLAPSQGGQWLATSTPVSLPAGGGWGTYDVGITASDLVDVQGGATYASVMPNVQTLRILHNDVPDPRGLIVNALLGIDNVEALPEPASALGTSAGVSMLLLLDLRRRRQNRS